MISGYARSGDMEAALELFMSMPSKNVVSWTVIISGYSQNKHYAKVLEFFLRMEKERNVRPNEVTVASILPACANLGALEVGERIEAYARKNGFFKNMYVRNAILDMYAIFQEKTGSSRKNDVASQIFDEIGSLRNLCSWNSMIMGLAVHGKWDKALELYNQMLREGTTPDDVTFVGLLLACTHGGMVVKGRKIFQSMEDEFHIIPKLEHYGCMVDLLGRAGHFHGNVELAEMAAKSLFELEPSNPGNYVILSNIYASAGQWDGVAKLRKLMKGGNITKAAGYSFIEEGGQLHKFIVEDKSHPRRAEIFALLTGIYTIIKLQRRITFCQWELEELSY
ncbi:Pentatricopeptide repeat-containing protein [Quillaja saponaria]|uniref:Pentatricopeptide repeat-containing protein n=1 Tax=Quillaja saponaria TaxID=32244 RepID=A0AAD7PN77_QUISA|nr:Pentatricopeptide repeat-containing protein [Quillaja saponaria]